MQATYDTWQDMIGNIQTNNGPDLHHTLNYLALPDDPIYIAAPISSAVICSPAMGRRISSS